MVLTEQEIRKLQTQHPTENNPMPFARAIESAVLEKLKAQEPVGETVPSIVWEGLVSIAWEADKQPPPGTKLYEHPLPPDDVVRDAERYRFLRDEAYLVNPVVAVVWKRNDDRTESEWVNTVDGYSLDCHIDAAMEEMK